MKKRASNNTSKDRELDEPNHPDPHKEKGTQVKSNKPDKHKKDRELDEEVDESTEEE